MRRARGLPCGWWWWDGAWYSGCARVLRVGGMARHAQGLQRIMRGWRNGREGMGVRGWGACAATLPSHQTRANDVQCRGTAAWAGKKKSGRPEQSVASSARRAVRMPLVVGPRCSGGRARGHAHDAPRRRVRGRVRGARLHLGQRCTRTHVGTRAAPTATSRSGLPPQTCCCHAHDAAPQPRRPAPGHLTRALRAPMTAAAAPHTPRHPSVSPPGTQQTPPAAPHASPEQATPAPDPNQHGCTLASCCPAREREASALDSCRQRGALRAHG